MSKVLKVFVNLILLLFILTGIALLVPPLVGVTTVVAEEGMVTNMQTGSVAYALKKPLSELKAGDKILQTGEDSAYVYEITSLNAETGVVTVRPSDGAATQELTLRNTAQKEVITVPLIGYVSIAMQTTEGRIILGLAALLVIVLFIVAEIWSRRHEDEEDDEEEDEEDDGEAELTRRELKARQKEQKRLEKEKKKREKRGEGEEDQFFSELADKKRSADKRSEREYQKRQTGGVHSEPDDTEDDIRKSQLPEGDAEVFIEKIEEPEKDQAEWDELNAETASEDAAVEVLQPEDLEEPVRTADTDGEDMPVPETDTEKNVGTDTIPDVQAALEAALETQQIRQPEQMVEQGYPEEEAEQTQALEEIELAMPVRTVEELLQEAYSDGDDPVVKEDDTTGVTFVDYSECL